MLIRVDRGRVALKTVNDLLNLNRVSISGLNLLRVSESDILKTVNFTEGPEHGITILASALDLEHFSQIKLLKCMKSKIVHHLVLGKRLSRVYREISGHIIMRILCFHGFKEAELADDVLR